MPTYRNDKDYPVSWGAKLWAPGEERPVPFFMPGDLGLTKTSDDPAPASPILMSQDIEIAAAGSESLEIPYPPSGRYLLSALAISGEASIAIGGKEILLDSTADYNGRLPWGSVPSVTISSTEGATVRILAEEVE